MGAMSATVLRECSSHGESQHVFAQPLPSEHSMGEAAFLGLHVCFFYISSAQAAHCSRQRMTFNACWKNQYR
jgi:hypothetical protein